MHEFSFCQGIVAAVETEYKKYQSEKTRISTVSVVIGRLHQVIEDNLQMAYTMLTRDTAVEGSVLVIRMVDISYRCRVCNGEGVINPPYFLCAACNTGDLEILTGKELYLEKMELSRDE